MDTRMLLSRALMVLGSIALLVGVIDPMEGSVVILAGSCLTLAGAFLHPTFEHEVRYWLIVFVLIAAGVAALFIMSANGGIGGSTGRSNWWGLMLVPYPIGWGMGVIGIIRELIRFFRARHQIAVA